MVALSIAAPSTNAAAAALGGNLTGLIAVASVCRPNSRLNVRFSG
jgi:hypothetical protein